jgi:hypothetical protein
MRLCALSGFADFFGGRFTPNVLISVTGGASTLNLGNANFGWLG